MAKRIEAFPSQLLPPDLPWRVSQEELNYRDLSQFVQSVLANHTFQATCETVDPDYSSHPQFGLYALEVAPDSIHLEFFKRTWSDETLLAVDVINGVVSFTLLEPQQPLHHLPPELTDTEFALIYQIINFALPHSSTVDITIPRLLDKTHELATNIFNLTIKPNMSSSFQQPIHAESNRQGLMSEYQVDIQYEEGTVIIKVTQVPSQKALYRLLQKLVAVRPMEKQFVLQGGLNRYKERVITNVQVVSCQNGKESMVEIDMSSGKSMPSVDSDAELHQVLQDLDTLHQILTKQVHQAYQVTAKLDPARVT